MHCDFDMFILLSEASSVSNISGHCSLQARSKMTWKDKTC